MQIEKGYRVRDLCHRWGMSRIRESMTLISYRKINRQKTEHQLQIDIWKYLMAIGAFAWIENQPPYQRGRGYHKSATGVSDIIGIFRGRPLAIEVKIKGGKPPTVSQKQFISDSKNHGGVAFVAKSLNDVIEKLAAVKLRDNS